MIKRHIIETIYEYDKKGRVINKTIIETNEEDDGNLTTMSCTTSGSNYYCDEYNKVHKVNEPSSECNCGQHCIN